MSHLTGAPLLSPKHDASSEGDGHGVHISATDAYKEPDVIVPPDNFAVVETGLYRSALPNARNMPYVRTLRLNTVIILSSEKPGRSLCNFFDSNGIRVAHTGLHGWSADQTSWTPISEDVVKDSLELILRRDRYPVLVCDIGGVHLVGMVIGCLRRLQNWNLNSVVHEYRSFAAAKTRYVNEQFIELFDTDLVCIPDVPAQWFADLLEMERSERSEFRQLVQSGLVDDCGTLVDTAKSKSTQPKYVVYYYSWSSPLNSEPSGSEPRIETH